MPDSEPLVRRIWERILGDGPDSVSAETIAAAVAARDPQLANRVLGALRRLEVLAEVADTVNETLSLDAQLPRLIGLITEALDAERATLFLHDPDSGELFSRVLQGEGVAEIRIPDTLGICGSVFASGGGEVIADAYADPRFNPDVDRQTGYRTRNMLCAPLRNGAGQVIGATQVLNKRADGFDSADLALLETINRQAANALEQSHLVERLDRARREEAEILEITEAISSELHLDTLLARIVGATTGLLNAERSTLFIYDHETDELWSKVAEGAAQKQIRIPSDAGIAGAAFTSGEVLNVPDAYADPRFNREVDRRSGFRTRNLIAMPVINRAGERRLGVIQVLNKRGGPFTSFDVRRLKAFCAGVAIAIHNARLFSDVLALKNYNEGILKSLSDGVVTLDQQFTVIKINEAGQRILGGDAAEMIGRPAEQVFGNRNAWITRSLHYVEHTGAADYHADTDLHLSDDTIASVNLTSVPFLDVDGKPSGYMLVLEDLTREKRVRNAMSRYMAKEVVDRLVAGGDDILKGSSLVATVLFSDIRRFTTISEAMTPRDTVTMLNEYFAEMVEVVFTHGGMLDKYIGDALMAIFGAPVATEADADNALLVATEMIEALGRFNALRVEHGEEPIHIGVGLATGEVLAGSIGSLKRMEYTVIGDKVNLASRLESANKYYGTNVLLAAGTAEALSGPRALRRLDLIQVKGMTQPTWVYESLGHRTKESMPGRDELIGVYEAGLARYQERDWDAALDHFSRALAIEPHDRPSRIFSHRARYYRAHPPGEGWNGVWVMGHK